MNNYCKKIAVSMLCTVTFICGTSVAGHVKIFLLGGQSNAAGSGLNSEYAAIYQTPQADVEFWVGGRFAGDGVPSYTWDRNASTSFGPLQLGSGNYTDGTYSGCEVSLGRFLKDEMPGENIAIVKYGMSGSALKRGLRSGDGAGDWDSDPAPLNGSFDGVRYHVFKNSAVLPALQAITDRGDTYEIAGMFWLQGETDAGNATAAGEYEANLHKLVNAVRSDFNAPTMPFFIGRLRAGISRPYLQTVRTATENVAKTDHHAYVVNTDDCALNADNIHFSAGGQTKLGNRFAKTWLYSKGLRGITEPIDESDYTATIRVACVGDSITYGSGIADRTNDSYPARLQALLGGGYDVQNFGRSGARISQISSNPYKGSSEYNAAIAFNPDIVIIALGVNDCSVSQWPANRDVFVADYKNLFDDFANLPASPKIWLGNLMPAVPPYEPYLAIQDTIAECDPMIEQVAIDKGVTLIDLFSPLNSEENIYAADGLHPNKDGAAIIADTVHETVTGNYGGLQMPFVFGDHMVLQRNEPIPVFGTADAGDTVTVTLDGNSKNMITDGNGRWRVDMPAMTAGGPYTLSVFDGTTTLNITDVLIGEVWLAAGQSNMAWQCNQDADWATQGPLANYPSIRLLNRVGDPWGGSGVFTQAELDKTNVDDFYTGVWEVCNPTTAADLSAVAYYFSRDIHLATGVPIGIIENAKGGTSMESYMTRDALDNEDVYLVMKDWLNADIATDWHRGRARQNLSLWFDNGEIGTMPHHPFEPTFLFDAEIADIIPFAIQGVLWYQGETNATDSSNQIAWDQEFTRTLFEGLISGWRAEWGQGDFPFYYVQLPNLNREWMLFREMQLQTLDALDNVGMAVTIDVGNPTNVHPTAKQEVGNRLSLWARANEYGESLVYSGPLYNGSFVDEGATPRIGFDHVGSGLQADGGEALVGFEVADAYGNWYDATAIIDGSEIVVSSTSVDDPRSMRYAWAQNPAISLINAEGLPASPFRAGNFQVNQDPCVVFQDDFQDYDVENPSDFKIDGVASGNWTASNTASDATRIFDTSNFGGTRLWISNVDGSSITSKGIDVEDDTNYSLSAVLVSETSNGSRQLDATIDLLVGADPATAASIIGGPSLAVTAGDDWDVADSKEDHVFVVDFATGNLNPDDKLFIRITRVGIHSGSSSAWFGVDDVSVKYNLIGDFDDDCDVDLDDFARFAEYWLASGCVDIPLCGGADLTGDAAVNIDDLAVVAANWLSTVIPPVDPMQTVAEYDSGVLAQAGASGADDPVNQGWIESPGIGTNAYADGYDSGNGGWRTVDGTTGANAYYQYNISVEDAANMANGWSATWIVSMDSDAISAGGTVSSDFYYPPNNDRQNSLYAWVETVGSQTYILGLNIDGNSDLYADDGTANHQLTTDGSAYDTFKTMTLDFDGVGATLTLDSTTVALNGHSFHASNRVVMGSGSSGGLGSAIWNNFKVMASQ